MNSEIRIFESKHFGKLRGMFINGERWFVASDVCKALNIGNNGEAVSRLDKEDKRTVVLANGSRGNPNTTLVNEPGFYSLVLGSRKEEANAFKHWITHDVLPNAIRGLSKRPVSESKASQTSPNG